MTEGEREDLVYEVQRHLSLIEATAILAFVAAVNQSTENRHAWLKRAARAYIAGVNLDDPTE
jgi:hypothetical protein